MRLTDTALAAANLEGMRFRDPPLFAVFHPTASKFLEKDFTGRGMYGVELAQVAGAGAPQQIARYSIAK